MWLSERPFLLMRSRKNFSAPDKSYIPIELKTYEKYILLPKRIGEVLHG